MEEYAIREGGLLLLQGMEITVVSARNQEVRLRVERPERGRILRSSEKKPVDTLKSDD